MTRIESAQSAQSAANLLLALGSGAAALIYEVVWFQILELIIGSTAVSLAIVLATFMGGTCLGSVLFPRLISTRRHPLRVYATIEFGIAGFGVAILLLMPRVGAAFLLLPPTLLMGATLPALSRSIKASSDRAFRLGLFYTA